MANYSNLKTAIENAVDWNNGDNEITGQNLLDILETIIDSLGAKYKFADVATPSSSITTPDEPLFYLAGAGTYTNFSGLSVTIPRGTLAIFYYDTAWHYTTVRTDSDAFFNVNQYLGAPSTTYTKANGRNAVPAALRSKGMIITYLTTNGWLIEQNLSTSGTWNADANWQTIGPVSVSQNIETGKKELLIGGIPALIVDNVPEAGSENLVKSGGVESILPLFNMVCKGDTAVEGFYKDIIVGHSYKLWIKNIQQPISELTIGDSSFLLAVRCFTDDSNYAEVVRVDKGGFDGFSPFYSFSAPSNAKFVKVLLRGNTGFEQELILEDTTSYKDVTGDFFKFSSISELGTVSGGNKFGYNTNTGAFCLHKEDGSNKQQILISFNDTNNIQIRKSTDGGSTWSDWQPVDIIGEAIAESTKAISSGFINTLISNINIYLKAASNQVRLYNGGVSAIRQDANVIKDFIYVAATGVTETNLNKLMVWRDNNWNYYDGLKYDDIKAFIIDLLKDNSAATFETVSGAKIANLLEQVQSSIISACNDGKCVIPLWFQQGTLEPVTLNDTPKEVDSSTFVRTEKIYISPYYVVIPNGFVVSRVKYNSVGASIGNVTEHTESYLETNANANRVYDRLLIRKTDNSAITPDDVIKGGVKVINTDYTFFKSVELGYVEPYNGNLTALISDASVNAEHYKVFYVSDSGDSDYKKLIWYNGAAWVYRTDYTYDDILNHTLLSSPFSKEILELSDGKILSNSTKSGIAKSVVLNKEANLVNILVMSDTHANNHNAIPSIEAAVQIADSKSVDYAIHLGDIITTYELTNAQIISGLLDFDNRLQKADNILFCKGNHDCGHSDSTDVNLSNKQYRMLFQTHLPNAVSNDADADCCYYYIDVESKKVRIIVLDAFYDTILQDTQGITFGDYQADWLFNTALDFSDKQGWSAVIFMHYIAYSENYPQHEKDTINVIKAFANKGVTYTNTLTGHSYTFDAQLDTKFVGVIRGHRHSDMYDNTYGFNEIGVRAAFGSTPNVSIFTIDTVNGVLYETEIDGTDRSFTFPTPSINQ